MPKIRAAFDAGELQAQRVVAGTPGRYGGPCAIGVCLDDAMRRRLDQGQAGGYSLLVIFQRRTLQPLTVTAPEDQKNDWVALQQAHDAWLKGPDHGSEDAFEAQLTEIETKYGFAQPGRRRA